MKNKVIFLIIIFLDLTVGYTQNNVGIGTNTPDINSILEMKATDKGILIPRMSSVQRNNMTISLGMNQKGLMVFDNDSIQFYFWDGINWRSIASGPQGPPGIANVRNYGVTGTHFSTISLSTYTLVSDLTLAITLIDTASLNIFTTGQIRVTAAASFSPTITLGIFCNNVLLPQTIQSYDYLDTGWSISTFKVFPPGIYTFDIRGMTTSSSYSYRAGSYNNSQSSLIIQVFY